MKITTLKKIQEAQELHAIWSDIDIDLRFGDLTPEAFANKLGNCRQLLDAYTSLSAQLQDVRARLQDAGKGLGKDNGRVHQGMRASFGAKSPEYERAHKARIRKYPSRRGTKGNTDSQPPQSA